MNIFMGRALFEKSTLPKPHPQKLLDWEGDKNLV